MGKDLYDTSDKVKKLYQLASDEIGEDIAKLSFEGPSEELKRTRFTQPAILAHALSVLTILGDRVPAFDFACGHSLGEYAALAAVGAMTFEDAIKAVVKRASLMEDACQKTPGTMAAVMGLAPEKVDEICKEATDDNGVVIPANYNSKIQIAISGSVVSVDPFDGTRFEAFLADQNLGRLLVIDVGVVLPRPQQTMLPLAVVLDRLDAEKAECKENRQHEHQLEHANLLELCGPHRPRRSQRAANQDHRIEGAQILVEKVVPENEDLGND